MNKHILTALAFALTGTVASAQTLFTYGGEAVSAQEFLKAYQKNNTAAKSPDALKSYLELYIASRLKVREAKERGYDTLPQLLADLDNLRAQILPGYLTDDESIKALVKEAFQRSQKDLHIAHIFIAATNNDTAAAYQKAQQAYQQLKGGKPFATVAQTFSDDPSAKNNDGDMGYVTAFTLPYEFENIVYRTPVGQVSAIHKSKAGYHIFKNLGERKAVGQLRAAQILLAYPPDADAATKERVKKQADSIYNRLLKGDDFGKLAAQLSADPVSAAANGQVPVFGVGQYDPAFESVAFGLAKDGAISKPFQTAHGWHIVKRLGVEAVPADFNSAKVQDELPDRVKASDRIQTTNNAAIQKAMAQFKAASFTPASLWAYSDSLLNNKPGATASGLQAQSALFQLGSDAATVDNWIRFAQANRFKSDGSGLKSYTQLWDEFVAATAMEYYKKHLELFNPAFKAQMDEFKDGNLFFEIMQREVWNKAQTDSVALLTYYNQHKDKYIWKESADAVVFYASDIPTAQLFYKELSKAPQNWRTIAGNFGDQIVADSNRFEIEQIPGATKTSKAGSVSPLVPNKEDNTASCSYIVKRYMKPEPRDFAASRGLVINDYQADLEKQWLEQLKKKYPVVVDEKVLATLLKQ
jgi:peptidyl-prolyl cis-trans isomerase SurA